MSSVIKQLSEFIDTAERNRKYPTGTATGRRAALRLFEQELNEEEKESLDTLRSNLEQIYQNVFNKNKSKMSAESLVTYKQRIEKLIEDYETYGADPTKLATWNRPTRKSKSSALQANNQKSSGVSVSDEETKLEKDVPLSRFELPLRTGVKAIIIVPSDIKTNEVNTLRKYIDFLESIAQKDGEVDQNEKN